MLKMNLQNLNVKMDPKKVTARNGCTLVKRHSAAANSKQILESRLHYWTKNLSSRVVGFSSFRS
jgi:hypothetical protein